TTPAPLTPLPPALFQQGLGRTQFVAMAMEDLPLAVLATVAMRHAQGARDALAVGGADHVFEVDGDRDVAADLRQQVLDAGPLGDHRLAVPVESGAHL